MDNKILYIKLTKNGFDYRIINNELKESENEN